MTAAVAMSPGVALDIERCLIVDDVRGEVVELNGTATAMLHRLESAAMDDCAQTMATDLDIEVGRVRNDLSALCMRLNARALVNFDGVHRRLLMDWFGDGIRLLRLGVAPGWPPFPVTRRRVDTSTLLGTLVTVVRGGLGVAALWAAVSTFFLLLTFTMTTRPSFSVEELVGAAMFGLSIGAAVVIHEVGHALLLRGVPTVLVTRGPRVFVLHRHVGEVRARWVAAAGPVFAAVLGVATILVAYHSGTQLLLPLGLTLALQSLALTVAADDGRHLVGLRPATSSWLG